ncbi:MAG: DUF2283 domain-containing protein [Bryobacteraceae bacterium]|nr:DUF2283 domain-containing protein [Bryobacteraceae bacterium]
MNITYDTKHDVLYIAFDDGRNPVVNREIGDVILDIDESDHIAGIEILDASKRIRLEQIDSFQFRKTA